MLENTLIYNPDIEKQSLFDEITSLEQKITILSESSKLLEMTILELLLVRQSQSCFIDFAKSDLLTSLQEKWPTKICTKISKSAKIFNFDATKFLIKSKKQYVGTDLTKINTKLLDVWNEQFNILQNEITKLQNIKEQLTQQYDKFIVQTGIFTTDIDDNETSKIKLPSMNRCCVDIQHIIENQWYEWPSDIETLSNNKFKPKDAGLGAGEHWLATVFGGEVQGSNSTFDLVIYNKHTSQFENWEVKEFDPKTLIVRLGTHGTDMAFDMSHEITSVLVQLKHFIEAFDALQLYEINESIGTCDLNIHKYITSYVESLKEYLNIYYDKIILKGDISNTDLKHLLAPIVGASKLFQDANNLYENEESTIKFCNRKIKLSSEQYAKFLLIVPDILTFREKIIALVSILKHPVLQGKQTYSQFLQNWSYMLKPSQAFSNVEGVFLVHKNGFMKISRNNTDNVFEYCRMSQGRRPNFKIKNIIVPTSSSIKHLNFFGHSHFNDSIGLFTPPVQISGSFDCIGGCVTKTDNELFNITTPWQNIEFNTEIFDAKQQIKLLPCL